MDQDQSSELVNSAERKQGVEYIVSEVSRRLKTKSELLERN